MKDKGQAQVIATVLIILLVLAAVVIVWQVVRNATTEGTEQIEGGTECLSIGLEILSADAVANIVTVKRNAGSGDLAKIKVLVGGSSIKDYDVTLLPLETEVIDITTDHDLVSGEAIEIAAILDSGKICNVADTFTTP